MSIRAPNTRDVDGLRHVIRPVVRYRYYTDPDDEGEIAAIDRAAFDTNRPILDLSEVRNTDQIEQQHLVRRAIAGSIPLRHPPRVPRTA